MLLHHSFIRSSKSHRSKLFVVDRATGHRLSYSRALTGVLLLADRLKALPSGFLGVMLPTSAAAALGVIASLVSGRTPVMINYATGAEAHARAAQRRCGFRSILTSRKLLDRLGCPPVDGMVFIEDVLGEAGGLRKIAAAAKALLPTPLLLRTVAGGSEDDTSVVLFTSGSERDPKLVQLSHRNIASNIESTEQAYGVEEGDIILASLPFFHVFGLTTTLWLPAVLGMTAVTCANPLDFSGVCAACRDERPTIMVGTPSFYYGYLRKSRPGDFESLRIMVAGADKCPDDLRAGYLGKHGKTLLEGYGATETSPVISANTLTHNRPGSVGRPLPGVEVRIENYENGDDCAVGEVGRILVRGDLVMKGYLNDLEATSMSIRHGWYDTGDMGRFDKDGYLWHHGRLKRFVKVGGEMVSLIRVEEVLSALLPDEVECCVVAVPDPMKGSRIVATVTADVDRQGVVKSMTRELPNIAVPKQFVVLDELPTMPSGKTDFRTITSLVTERLSS